MNVLNFIPEKIDQIQKEIGLSNYASFFEIASQHSNTIIDEKRFHIDVFYSANGIDKIRKNITSLKNLDSRTFKYNIIFEENFNRVLFPTIQASCCVLLVDTEFTASSSLIKNLQSKIKDYKTILLFEYEENHHFETSLDSLILFNQKLIKSKVDALDFDLIAEIEAILSKENIPNLHLLSLTKSMEPLVDILDEIIKNENKSILTRKLLNSQDNQVIKKEEVRFNSGETLSIIKNIIQKNTVELERNLKFKYEDLNKPNVGLFSKEIATFCQNIEEFKLEALAEKSEKINTQLEEEQVEEFLNRNEQLLTSEFEKDKKNAIKIFEEIIEKINEVLSARNVKVLKPKPISLDGIDRKRILKSANYIQRPYNGEITKKGAMEYFVALRDYTGLMMVVVGLLAPLNMIASASDGNDILKNFSAELKELASVVRISTALITLSLILYGINDLRRRIPLKRIEEKERELNKARESINQEGKRIYSESSRDWINNISIWIKDNIQEIFDDVEANVREFQDKRSQIISSDKTLQQKNMQAIEQALRSMQLAEKHRDFITSKFKELSTAAQK